MPSKKGLGRGLDTLLPELNEPAGTTEIALAEIDPNPDQPRRDFDREGLETLAASIRQSGVLQPLLVAPEGGRYRIVAGERRFRAARMAGLQSVPCVVRELDEAQRMEAALIENLQREDLNPIEEAAGIRALMDQCGYTQEMAAQRVGRSRPAVANLLRLLSLPEEIQDMVRSGALTAGHARVLAGVAGEHRRLDLARRIVSEGLNVRQAEHLAAMPDQPEGKPLPPPLAVELEDMRQRLQRAIGVKTTLRGSLKRGRVVLQYSTAEELEAIYAALEMLEQ